MHKNVLSKEQLELLPLIKLFSREFYLAGGTAVALHIGHRRSIDFDLFTNKSLKRGRIKRIIEKSKYPVQNILYEDHDQMHLIINSVKMTFFNFPTEIKHPVDLEGIVKIPVLLDLAAMKAYALGGRAKWKDYVDLYFIMKDHYTLKEISNNAKKIFESFFNEKLLREQLSYFKDIDYSEKLEYLGEEVGDAVIRKFLIEKSIIPFE
ncbi:MAG: nucleotidyl transferase AbiEii/AbiGii toxin family protein [bacterium]|nr:nucleotidyl transferase AbiEii/AbiGii toxin family protein [bacterium]